MVCVFVTAHLWCECILYNGGGRKKKGDATLLNDSDDDEEEEEERVKIKTKTKGRISLKAKPNDNTNRYDTGNLFNKTGIATAKPKVIAKGAEKNAKTKPEASKGLSLTQNTNANKSALPSDGAGGAIATNAGLSKKGLV
ncbi:hypothetical protein RFI_18807, partial [Reticulomyxa filosa]